MALFDQAFKDEVRSKNDIVEVISSYVKLEQRGNRYVGLCPFHAEKTPSFHVIPQQQFYHCFGCKASGDVFTFLQEREHMSFYETLVHLAKRARIPLPKEERTPEEEKAYRERRALFDALDLAARFFHNQLLTEPGKAGLAYLTGRGLTEETIRRFRLGWAPGYGRLYQSLRSRFPADVLVKAGLIMPRREGSGYMDAFFDRVMFPITDLTGRIIGFGGRILEGNGPKYKNTAETPLFTKRHVLFGLAQAKEAIRTKNQAILVEGYMDVIMPHQVGVDNVIAPLGTALTEEQCKLLRQQAEQVIVAFDSDTAGQMATLRGLEILYDTGCDVRILRLPDGKDPDEFIRAHGVAGFQQCIAEAMPLVEFKLLRAIERNPDSKTKAVEAVARVLMDMQNEVQREEYVSKIGNIFARGTQAAGPDENLGKAIRQEMNRLLGFQHNQPNSRNNSRDLGFPGAGAAAHPAERPAAPGSPLAVKATEDDLVRKAERTLVFLFLEYPGFLARVEHALGVEPFSDPVHMSIFVAAKSAVAAGPTSGSLLTRLLDTLRDADARALLSELAVNPPVSGNPEQEAAHCIEKIIWHRFSRRKVDLEKQIKALEATGQQVPASLVQEFIDISRKLKMPSKS
ncbi:MAG TPA: DNA primase [Symbiobacteriaceae bacterium]|nr:DNA primase [Symbiobacteriaceae bacterium]